MAPMSLDAAFQLLGLDRGMDDGSIDAEAKKAYRRLAQKAHPDKGGSTEEFQRLGEAYERVCSRNESPFSSMGGGMGAGDVEEMLRQMFGGNGEMIEMKARTRTRTHVCTAHSTALERST